MNIEIIAQDTRLSETESVFCTFPDGCEGPAERFLDARCTWFWACRLEVNGTVIRAYENFGVPVRGKI